MSASERLKALDEAMHPTPWRPKKGNVMQSPMVLEADVIPFDSTASAPGMAALRNALPELIAVVEAAEKVTFYGQDAHRYNEWHGSSIVKALAALDAKLSVT